MNIKKEVEWSVSRYELAQCKKTYQSEIKMKPVDWKSSTFIDFGIENKKDPKFDFGDHGRTSNYKKPLQKVTIQIFLIKSFVIKNFKNIVMDISNKRSKWGRNFIKINRKGSQKTNETEFRVREVIKRKGDKPYFRWKHYDN